MSKLKETAVVFTVGAAGYTLLELLWRRRTHWTMALTGGFCFAALYRLNRRCKCGVVKKCALGTLTITAAEFGVGLIVNKLFKLNVWDYSRQPLNICGQVCPLYSALWFLLCLPGCALCDSLKKALSK